MNNIHYSFLTFVLIFYAYAFLGWCFESTYVSLKSRKPVNRGFMKGPFLPIYGFGGVAILFATTPFMSNPVLVFIASTITATLIELVTGAVMESLFKVRYWDYSSCFMNYKGYICLGSSIAWGFMGMLVAYVINEPFASAIEGLPKTVTLCITAVISVFFIWDLVQSFRTAYSLRSLIIENEKLMTELKELKEGIGEAIEEQKNKAEEKGRAIAAELREKIDTALTYTEADEYIMSKIEVLKNFSLEDKLDNWRERHAELVSAIKSLDRRKISLLRRNPSARARSGLINEIREYRRKENVSG